MRTAIEVAIERELIAVGESDYAMLEDIGRLQQAAGAITAARRQPEYWKLTRRHAEACRAQDWTTAYRLNSQRCELVRRQLRAGPARQAGAAKPGPLAARNRWIQQQEDILARHQWLNRLAGE